MKTNELNAKSLMIGDWVMLNGHPHQVQELLVDSVTLQCWPYLYENIKPIPLTPEILEENGFAGVGFAILKLDENSLLQYYYHEHRLKKYWFGIDERQNDASVTDVIFQCKCYYVHELQHALRLCGNEKEIVL